MDAPASAPAPSTSDFASAVAQLAAKHPDLPKDLLAQVLRACQGDLAQTEQLIDQLRAEDGDENDDGEDDDDEDGEESNGAAPSAGGEPTGTSTTQLYGSHESTCGYCKSSPLKTTRTFGMACKTLTPLDYQAMIDLGWRRSGNYCYKQDNAWSCCPHYTIRLQVAKHRSTKAQRKAVNRFERFLKGEDVRAQHHADEDATMTSATDKASSSSSTKAPASADPHAEQIRQRIVAAIETLVAQDQLPASVTPAVYAQALRVYPYVEPAKKGGKPAAAVASDSTQPHWNYTSNAALILSGFLKKQGVVQSAVDIAKQLIQTSGLEATVAEPQGYLNVHVALPEGHTPRARSTSADSKAPAAKRQPFEKKPIASSIAPAPAAPALTPHTFEVRQVPAIFNAEAFAIYKKYQMSVHGDKESKLTPSQYTQFLCSSNLQLEGPYGGFHHHYLLDGKIIAVGVVDVLPRCLSSVYLFFDPAYNFLELGTVTAMREIEFVRTELMPHFPECSNYYLGYYVHSCQKMRYKSKFEPAELLCPVRGTWHPFDGCRPALDSLTQQQREAATSTTPAAVAMRTSGRCVIFSDVCDETREADGSRPAYLSPSFVQHKTHSASTDSASIAASSTAAAAASSAAPAASSSVHPKIDASHPYVFSIASKAEGDAHRLAVIKAAEPEIPMSLPKRPTVAYKAVEPFIVRQIQSVVREYALLIGAELAQRMLVTF